MQAPVEFIELNMGNYDDDQVAQLNQWAIWAAGQIERDAAAFERAKIELAGIIESIPQQYRILYRPGSGCEEPIATLAMSVCKLVDEVLRLSKVVG